MNEIECGEVEREIRSRKDWRKGYIRSHPGVNRISRTRKKKRAPFRLEL